MNIILLIKKDLFSCLTDLALKSFIGQEMIIKILDIFLTSLCLLLS